MKKDILRTFPLLVLVFSALPLFAGKILIGRKSGSVTQIGMAGLKRGDTLAIRAGTYEEGGEFRNLEGVTIINEGGVVQFRAGLLIGGLRDVVFTGTGDGMSTPSRYGLRFSKFDGDAFTVESPCEGLRILNCAYDSVTGNALNASKFFTTYNGDNATLALFRTVMANQHLLHCGGVFLGSFDPVTSFHNVIDSLCFSNIIIDSTLTDGSEVVGISVYRMTAHDWIIRGGAPNGLHDVGVFMTHGNGSLYNIYRYGGWGYLWRLWNVGLNGKGESYLFNCIDLATANYGTIDTRVDASDTTTGSSTPFLRGGSIHVLNNTTGNKKDILGYVSVLVVAGDFFPQNGYKLEVRNNLGFNNAIRATNGLVLINTPNPVTDTSNNLYVSNPIRQGVLADTVNCFIEPGSPVIDEGIALKAVQSDIGGIHRPQHQDYDIGAREYTGSGAARRHSSFWNTIDWTKIIRLRYIAGLVTLMLLLVLVISQRSRKKKSGNAPSYPSTR